MSDFLHNRVRAWVMFVKRDWKGLVALRRLLIGALIAARPSREIRISGERVVWAWEWEWIAVQIGRARGERGMANGDSQWK